MSCEALKILFKDEIETACEDVRKSFAKEMLLDKVPDDEILKYTKISVEALNALKKSLSDTK